MRIGYVISAKFRKMERAISFHLFEAEADRKLAELLDARDLSNEDREFLGILEELDTEIVSWYNYIEDFKSVEYVKEKVQYE